MTYPKDREPLLRDSDCGNEIENEKWQHELFKFSDAISFIHIKRERICPRAVFLIVATILGLFLVDQYRISMRRTELEECNDVLAECENVPFNETLVPPFYNYLEDFTVSRRYDISLCLIPKVMSTIGTAVLCYIDDPHAFSNANRSIAHETYDGRFCEGNEMKSFASVSRNLHSDFENVIVVRDPFDRFISGFTEKCVKYEGLDLCHGCGVDIRCFLRKQYRRFMRMSMLFPVYTLADTHFAPQTWFCDMKNSLNKSKVIKYANRGEERDQMIDSILEVFERRNVTMEEQGEVRNELSKGKTIHSTRGSTIRLDYEKMMKEDVSIRRAIVRMYYYDFLYFGYKI
uniref:Sulfotransferase domain-containing protein n=1 Tax=Caenorhabditis japonica TaxID=281687 RepID=A0A8R1HUQ3_CAEJA